MRVASSQFRHVNGGNLYYFIILNMRMSNLVQVTFGNVGELGHDCDFAHRLDLPFRPIKVLITECVGTPTATLLITDAVPATAFATAFIEASLIEYVWS